MLHACPLLLQTRTHMQLGANAARLNGRPRRALCGSTLSAQALRIRQNAGRGGGGKHMGPVAKLLRLA